MTALDMFSQLAMEKLAEELEADAATYGREADRAASHLDAVVDAARLSGRSEALYNAATLLRVRAGLAPRGDATFHDLTKEG